MPIYLQIENGVAVNAAMADAKWAAQQPGTWREAVGDAGIGWLWDGESWSEATPPPQTDAEKAAAITLRRAAFFLALDGALGLTDADPLVEDYLTTQVQASTTLDAATKRLALTLLRSAVTFPRHDPDAPGLLEGLGAELGLTPAAIDTLFIQTAAAGGAT